MAVETGQCCAVTYLCATFSGWAQALNEGTVAQWCLPIIRDIRPVIYHWYWPIIRDIGTAIYHVDHSQVYMWLCLHVITGLWDLHILQGQFSSLLWLMWCQFIFITLFASTSQRDAQTGNPQRWSLSAHICPGVHWGIPWEARVYNQRLYI